MTRTGKIARLPREIREQLNRRIADGEPGQRLVEWLNSLPETRRVLDKDFDGRAINEPNLSDWKQGGHRDWLTRQETLACVGDLAGEAGDLAAAAKGSLADSLATVLSARYAALLDGWNGEMDEEFRRKLRSLRMLCQDVAELRRGDHFAERLRLDLERFEEARKDEEALALEAVLEEARQWPEVIAAFREFLALYKRRRGKSDTSQPPVHSATQTVQP